MRTSAEINAEIFNYGHALFDLVKTEIRENATRANTAVEHQRNQQMLDVEIASVMGQAVFRTDLNHTELWQILWQRVVYAGTNNVKATAEIASMRTLIPLFQSLDNYADSEFVFDKNEWQDFVNVWKGRYPGSNWLQQSKNDREWSPERHFKITTPAVWRILIKDQSIYPNLRFSALDHKAEKYFNLARILSHRKASGEERALRHYMGNYVYNPNHLTGQAWLDERAILKNVRKQFQDEVGTLTALHTMMDLGLKTIKPDRVMTYLFSRLGWLQTLPNTYSQEQILKEYMRPEVIEEMSVRSDVLANRLDLAGLQQTHRLLDIWLVKYGQNAEPAWGITVNLQDHGRDILDLLDNIKSSHTPEISITADEAAQRWPTGDYPSVFAARPPGGPRINDGHKDGRTPSRSRNASPKPRREAGRPSPAKRSKEESERLFRTQWKQGRASQPDVYPERMDNRPKDKILKLIEKGTDPEAAFLSVLGTEETYLP